MRSKQVATICLSGILPGFSFAGATIFANSVLGLPLPVICTTGEPDIRVEEYATRLHFESMTDSHSLRPQGVVQFLVLIVYLWGAFVVDEVDGAHFVDVDGIWGILPPMIRSLACFTASTCFINQQS